MHKEPLKGRDDTIFDVTIFIIGCCSPAREIPVVDIRDTRHILCGQLRKSDRRLEGIAKQCPSVFGLIQRGGGYRARMFRASYGQGFGPGTRSAVFIICKHRDQEAGTCRNNGSQVGNRNPSSSFISSETGIPDKNIWLSSGMRCSGSALCPESIQQSGVCLPFLRRREQAPAFIFSQNDRDRIYIGNGYNSVVGCQITSVRNSVGNRCWITCKPLLGCKCDGSIRDHGPGSFARDHQFFTIFRKFWLHCLFRYSSYDDCFGNDVVLVLIIILISQLSWFVIIQDIHSYRSSKGIIYGFMILCDRRIVDV